MATPIPLGGSPLALPADVASAWRPLNPAELVVAETHLDYASALIRSAFPGVDARVASNDLDASIPRYVATAMVKRVLSNPDGKRQEAIDDYSFTRDGDVASGGLYISGPEAAMLQSAPTIFLPGAYTVGLG